MFSARRVSRLATGYISIPPSRSVCRSAAGRDRSGPRRRRDEITLYDPLCDSYAMADGARIQKLNPSSGRAFATWPCGDLPIRHSGRPASTPSSAMTSPSLASSANAHIMQGCSLQLVGLARPRLLFQGYREARPCLWRRRRLGLAGHSDLRRDRRADAPPRDGRRRSIESRQSSTHHHERRDCYEYAASWLRLSSMWRRHHIR